MGRTLQNIVVHLRTVCMSQNAVTVCLVKGRDQSDRMRHMSVAQQLDIQSEVRGAIV